MVGWNLYAFEQFVSIPLHEFEYTIFLDLEALDPLRVWKPSVDVVTMKTLFLLLSCVLSS